MSNLFSEEQQLLKSTAADLFAKAYDLEGLIKNLSPDAPFTRDRWMQMTEVGLTAVSVPEDLGGLGMTVADLALILEEVGYAAVPEPLLETAAVVVPLIDRYGSDEARERWLPAIASGEVMATFQPAIAVGATYGVDADLALVETPDGLVLVEGPGGTPVPSMDRARRIGHVDASSGAALGDGEAAREAQTLARAAASAVLNGLGRRLVDESVAYAQERQQFGRAIGSFQAVKHMLAEAITSVETSRPAAWAALADAASGAPTRFQSAAVAKSSANAAAALAGEHALQVHGGIGFTWEHHLHVWLKRGKALEAIFGSTEAVERELGSMVLSADDLVREFGPQLAQ